MLCSAPCGHVRGRAAAHRNAAQRSVRRNRSDAHGSNVAQSAQREACVCVRVWNNSWRVVGETHPLIVFQQNAALLPESVAWMNACESRALEAEGGRIERRQETDFWWFVSCLHYSSVLCKTSRRSKKFQTRNHFICEIYENQQKWSFFADGEATQIIITTRFPLHQLWRVHYLPELPFSTLTSDQQLVLTLN